MDRRCIVFFVMFLLSCGSKKNVTNKSFKHTAIQHKNERLESAQIADPLGTTCGPPVDKHCCIRHAGNIPRFILQLRSMSMQLRRIMANKTVGTAT
jgi:hypothetical protein